MEHAGNEYSKNQALHNGRLHNGNINHLEGSDSIVNNSHNTETKIILAKNVIGSAPLSSLGAGQNQTEPTEPRAFVRDQVRYAYTCFRKRNQEDLTSLKTTHRMFLQARDDYKADIGLSDPSLLLRIYWHLMILSKELSCIKQLDGQRKLRHVEEAQMFNMEANGILKRIRADGRHAQVELERHILIGRKAILQAREGIGGESNEATRRNAAHGIDGALERLRKTNREGYEKAIVYARSWRDSFHRLPS